MTFKPRSVCFRFAVMAVIASAGTVAIAQTRIYFARGATRATALGYLRCKNDQALFVLRPGAGQHMRVESKGASPNPRMVTFPSGEGDVGPRDRVCDTNTP